MRAFRKKVRYVGGAGLNLFKPLSDGQNTFSKDLVYTITNEKDFNRLLKCDFVEVGLVVAPVETPAEEIKVETPAEETQVLGRHLPKGNNTELNGESK